MSRSREHDSLPRQVRAQSQPDVVASTAPESVELYGHFASSIRKLFRRVQAYWLGPEAMRLFAGGMRFTVGIRASSKLDLRLE